LLNEILAGQKQTVWEKTEREAADVSMARKASTDAISRDQGIGFGRNKVEGVSNNISRYFKTHVISRTL